MCRFENGYIFSGLEIEIPLPMKPHFLYLLLGLLFLISCNGQPSDKTIQQAVHDFYRESSLQAGAASHDLSDLQVIQVEPTEKGFKAQVQVSGQAGGAALPGGDPKRDFSSKLFHYLEKQNDRWKVVRVEEP
jgi:hypothetical protein